MSSNESRLPPEVIDNICEYLPRPDLRVLRITSRHTQFSAERELFRTIYLQFNLRSFQRLEYITDHPRLREYMRILDYDGRQVGSESFGLGVTVWKAINAGEGMRFDGHAKETFLAQFSDQQCDRFYASYYEYVYGQQFLLDNNNSNRLLSIAIPKLPGLRGVRYSSPWDRVGDGGTTLWKDLSPVAQAILEEPEGFRTYKLDNFWPLVVPICGFACNPQLVSIHGKDMELLRWSKIAKTVFSNGFSNLSSLRHLGLEFYADYFHPGSMSTLSEVIAHVPALRSLRLSFTDIESEGKKGLANLERILCKAPQFPHLRTLSIEAVIAPHNFLRAFLSSHSQTLRSVELSHIGLWDMVPSQLAEMADDDLEDEKPDIGSFFDLFKFMQETLSLDHVKFNGNLSNAWDEAWYSDEIDNEGNTWPHDCLKYKIERFITKGEPWPFQSSSAHEDEDEDAGRDGSEDEDGYSEEEEDDDFWTYEDASWRRQNIY